MVATLQLILYAALLLPGLIQVCHSYSIGFLP